MLLAELFSAHREDFPIECFGLCEAGFVAQHVGYVLDQSGHLLIVGAQQSRFERQRFAKEVFGLIQLMRALEHDSETIQRVDQVRIAVSRPASLHLEGLATRGFSLSQFLHVHQGIAEQGKSASNPGVGLLKKGAAQPQDFAGNLLHRLVKSRLMVRASQGHV